MYVRMYIRMYYIHTYIRTYVRTYIHTHMHTHTHTGKDLTASVRQTHVDFEQAIEVFKHAKYDHMDVESKQFDTDFYNFQSQIKELERRLASVITQAFDDSVTVLLRFKLLDAFEGILERDVVQTDLEKKNSDLLNEYAADLKQVQEIFMLCMDLPPINNNAPPRAGAVTWVRALMERVQEPMDRFQVVCLSR
jgi:dynein heavy chain